VQNRREFLGERQGTARSSGLQQLVVATRGAVQMPAGGCWQDAIGSITKGRFCADIRKETAKFAFVDFSTPKEFDRRC